MNQPNDTTKKCPACRQEIDAEAVRCKHCLADIRGLEPTHGGTCPQCREKIDPQAHRCHHCYSDLIDHARALGLGRLSDQSFMTISGDHSTAVPLGAGQAMRLGAARGDLSAPSDGGFAFGRERCFWVLVPVCDVVEEIDPIAGYKPSRLENCRWERRQVCVWSPI